jgi:hypothetical protein
MYLNSSFLPIGAASRLASRLREGPRMDFFEPRDSDDVRRKVPSPETARPASRVWEVVHPRMDVFEPVESDVQRKVLSPPPGTAALPTCERPCPVADTNGAFVGGTHKHPEEGSIVRTEEGSTVRTEKSTMEKKKCASVYVGRGVAAPSRSMNKSRTLSANSKKRSHLGTSKPPPPKPILCYKSRVERALQQSGASIDSVLAANKGKDKGKDKDKDKDKETISVRCSRGGRAASPDGLSPPPSTIDTEDDPPLDVENGGGAALQGGEARRRRLEAEAEIARHKPTTGKFKDIVSRNFIKLNLKRRGRKGGQGPRLGGFNKFGQSSHFGHLKKKVWGARDGPNLVVDKYDETDQHPLSNVFGDFGRKQGGRVDILEECLKAYLRNQRHERQGDDMGMMAEAEEARRVVRCPVHQLCAKLLTVKKAGTPNKGRRFYACTQPACRFFLWEDDDVNMALEEFLKPERFFVSFFVSFPPDGVYMDQNCPCHRTRRGLRLKAQGLIRLMP